MNRAISILATLIVCMASTEDAAACTVAVSPKDSKTRFVFLGRIESHSEAHWNGDSIFGFKIQPLIEFQKPQGTTDPPYTVFPHRLVASCEPLFLPPGKHSEESFAVGSLVAVYAEPALQPWPGDFSLMMGLDFEILPKTCDWKRVAEARPDYSSGDPSCGSLMFHAVKEISTFGSETQDSIVASLTRIAEIAEFTYFPDLLDSYVGSSDDRQAVLHIRYGNLLEDGCTKRPSFPAATGKSHSQYLAEKQIYTRWNEYCLRR